MGLAGGIAVGSLSATIGSIACTDITLTLPTPDNAMIGMKNRVRKLGTDDVAIYAHSGGKIWRYSEFTYFTIANDDTCDFEWDGNYWVTNYINN